MKMFCPHCGTFLQTGDVDFDRRVGTCRSCGTSVDLTDGLEPNPVVDGLQCKVVDGSLTISIAWRGPYLIYESFACACYIAIFGFLCTLNHESLTPWMMILNLVLYPLVIVKLLCNIAASLFNRTVIHIAESGNIEISHGPILWTRTAKIAPSERPHLYIELQSFAARLRYGKSSKNGENPRQLIVFTEEGRIICMAPRLKSVAQAQFLKHRIKEYLKLFGSTPVEDVAE